jgi:hypothetical protein
MTRVYGLPKSKKPVIFNQCLSVFIRGKTLVLIRVRLR